MHSLLGSTPHSWRLSIPSVQVGEVMKAFQLRKILNDKVDASTLYPEDDVIVATPSGDMHIARLGERRDGTLVIRLVKKGDR